MRQLFPYGNLLVEDLTKTTFERFTKHHNVTSYPADFPLIIVFVDAQGLYRHISSIIHSFPNIAETAGSNCTIAHSFYSLSGDGIRDGEEVSVVTQPPKLFGYQRIKRSVPQDLYRLVHVRSCSCIAIAPYQRPPTEPYPPLPASLKRVAVESGVSRVHTLDIWQDILGNRLLVADQAGLKIRLGEGLESCQNPRAMKEMLSLTCPEARHPLDPCGSGVYKPMANASGFPPKSWLLVPTILEHFP